MHTKAATSHTRVAQVTSEGGAPFAERQGPVTTAELALLLYSIADEALPTALKYKGDACSFSEESALGWNGVVDETACQFSDVLLLAWYYTV